MELIHLVGVGAIARKDENVGFTCANCEAAVAPLSNGSCRNHCRRCGFSRPNRVAPDDTEALIALMQRR